MNASYCSVRDTMWKQHAYSHGVCNLINTIQIITFDKCNEYKVQTAMKVYQGESGLLWDLVVRSVRNWKLWNEQRQPDEELGGTCQAKETAFVESLSGEVSWYTEETVLSPALVGMF